MEAQKKAAVRAAFISFFMQETSRKDLFLNGSLVRMPSKLADSV